MSLLLGRAPGLVGDKYLLVPLQALLNVTVEVASAAGVLQGVDSGRGVLLQGPGRDTQEGGEGPQGNQQQEEGGEVW